MTNKAMACGLPAILNQVGYGVDLIDPRITGELFPTGDVASLAKAMAAWSDPERFYSAADAVRKKVAGYSVERAVDGILGGLHGGLSGALPFDRLVLRTTFSRA